MERRRERGEIGGKLKMDSGGKERAIEREGESMEKRWVNRLIGDLPRNGSGVAVEHGVGWGVEWRNS